MEQTPWKPILFAAIASFIMLVLVLFFSQPKHDTSRRVEKILEFDASSIVGRSEGKKVWEFSAVTGWVGNNRDATNLKDVKKGLFYKDGELLIKDFTAHEVAAYKKSKNVEAKTANALIVITGKKGKKKRKFSRISADFFKYNPDNKSSFLSGNIKLVDKKTG